MKLYIGRTVNIFGFICFLFIFPNTSVTAFTLGKLEKPLFSKHAIAKWNNMLQRHKKQIALEKSAPCEGGIFNRCYLKPWKEYLSEISGYSAIEKIKDINIYSNKVRYLSDIQNYNVSDYWATPKEFFRNRGDCEDYAITKYLSLKKTGFSINNMKIVVLMDRNTKQYHAILIVNFNNIKLVMDNVTNVVLEQRYFKHYDPIYSVNESGAWLYY